MASVRDLKLDLNCVLGDIIEAASFWELENPAADTKKSDAIKDEAFTIFDELIAKINQKDVENKKAHFKAISKELEERGSALLDKLAKLK